MTCNKQQAASEIVAAIEQSLPPARAWATSSTPSESRPAASCWWPIAIPAIIPAPGIPLGAVFGTVLVIIACRMAASGAGLGLPHWLAQVRLRAPVITLLSRRGLALLRCIEHRMRPRASLLVTRRSKPPLALVMALMGVLIALPIPFGNTLPGLSVILMGLGLAIGDGLAVLGALILAALATGISIVLAWAAWSGITHLLA